VQPFFSKADDGVKGLYPLYRRDEAKKVSQDCGLLYVN